MAVMMDIEVLRQSVTKVTQMLAGQGVPVTQQGMKAFVETDKRTGKVMRINIPHIPDTATESLVMAIQGFIDHEIGHVLDTDHKVQLKAKKLGDDYYSMWNIVEDTFVERSQQRRFPGAISNLRRLHKFFLQEITEPALARAKAEGKGIGSEFRMVLVPLIRSFAGQAEFADWIARNGAPYQHLIDRLTPFKGEVAVVRSTEDALKVAIKLRNALLDPPKKKPKAPPPPPPPPSSEEAGESEAGGGTSDEPDLHDRHEDDEEKGEKNAGDTGEGDTGEGDDAEKGDDAEDADDSGKGSLSSKSEDEDADDGEDADDADDGEGEERGSSDTGEEGEDDEGVGDSDEKNDDEDNEGDAADTGDDDADGASGDPDGDLEMEMDGTGTDELAETLKREGIADFDGMIEAKITEDALSAIASADYRVFTTDFDMIESFKVDDETYQDEWMTALDDKTRQLVGVMQKDIERLMAARSQSVRIPGFKSGRIHTGSLHRLLMGDDRVFRRKREAKSDDVVVGLLLDCSGSMNGVKIRTGAAAAYALSQTLERVRIKHEVLGFTTTQNAKMLKADVKRMKEENSRVGGFSRHEPLWIPVFKSMQERLTPEVRRRMAAIPYQAGLRNNIDGESVQIAARRLLACSEKRKVLIVLSDGAPAGVGDTRAMWAHLKRVVGETEAAGVETIGIGILTDQVKHFYPKNLVLKDVVDLPQAVMSELKDILLAA